ncbi:DUF885 domain-containing protein [Novosphingobium sp.]|uniref:DUF885 domain-containing protein n=1 Tax=Novosphingobium sp. TaxID=1874826 RepID=UPI0038B86AF9
MATSPRAMLDPPPAAGDAPAGTNAAQSGRTRTVRALSAGAANAALDRIFADDTREEAQLDPLGALERGEPVPQEHLLLLFTDTLANRQRAVNARTLQQLASIDRAALDPAHQLSYDAFAETMAEEQALLAPAVQAMTGVQPFNHFGGFHVAFPELVATDGVRPLRSAADFEARITLERSLPTLFANAIARFREGMASGVVEPRLTVDNMISQIDAILAQPIESSLFMAPARRLPAALPLATRRRLEQGFRAATHDAVYPAYRTLRDFLVREYRPAARASVGLSGMRGGDRLYRVLMQLHTTVSVDPATVHALGLSEVARIQREMVSVKNQIGYRGTLRAFFDEIRRNPRYHPRNAAELARGFHRVGDRVAELAPRWFVQLPRTPLLIEPYPEYRARFEAGGGYSQGSPDGARPGVFFFNTYDVHSRFLTGITTLYLHEGAPGHHFQISLAQENDGLPDFQRYGGNTAYVEGWALYAETLGYDMGLYTDPLQHWGTLDDEILRAMRLVVDTGLHAQGWSRDQAIAYMLANSGMGRSDAVAEVDRYIANPGQALAYKIGALTFQRLRHEAEAALGARFDIRGFHDQALGSGALPLGVLEAKIRRWIAAQQAAIQPPESQPASVPSSASAIRERVLATP